MSPKGKKPSRPVNHSAIDLASVTGASPSIRNADTELSYSVFVTELTMFYFDHVVDDLAERVAFYFGTSCRWR
jgi:hypothetical protein